MVNNMKTPRSKLRGIKRKIPLNLLEAGFGESHPKRFKILEICVRAAF